MECLRQVERESRRADVAAECPSCVWARVRELKILFHPSSSRPPRPSTKDLLKDGRGVAKAIITLLSFCPHLISAGSLSQAHLCSSLLHLSLI
ncbi:hypothetical protein J6590_036484 [Homalodisca vitripennis]|nr:hypothetical protein J6590_036484 [Homalodisca vitripennis]